MITSLSLFAKGKLLVMFMGIICFLAVPLPGCRSAHEAQLKGGQKDQSPSVISVGPRDMVLDSKRKPYSWPDGTMGLLKGTDGRSYRFFAASAGFPLSTKGSLEDPIRDEVHELKIEGIPDRFHYAAGGPIYKDERTGLLLMFYHAEIYTFPLGWLPFYSELGMARSTDGGMTWRDLGRVVTPHASVTSEFFQTLRGSWDVAWGAYTTNGEYFYLYFSDLLHEEEKFKPVPFTVARAKVRDVIDAAGERGEVAQWEKFYEGSWAEPGIGGRSSPLIEKDTFMMSDVAYNSYLNKYIGIVIGKPWPNTALYWLESADGVHWGNYQKLVNDEGHNFYASLIGVEHDPHLLDRQFFVYYVNSRDFASTGTRNKDGVLYRRLITLQ